VPDLVGTPRGQVRIEGRTLVLPFGRTEPLSEPVRRAHEEARAMAPVLEALAADQLTDAEQRVVRAQRVGGRMEELEAIEAELALLGGRPLPPLRPGAQRSAIQLRLALARRDPEAAAAHARELAALERSDDVAIEGLLEAAELVGEVDPPTALDLVGRALARRPRDASLARKWLERAEWVSDATTILEGVRSIQATVVGPGRVEVLCAASALLDRLGAHREARAGWEEACRLEPHHPVAAEGLASAYARAGLGEEALAAWDRAATLHRADSDAEARALIRAAECARAMNLLAGAEARLERSAQIAKTDRIRLEAWTALATVRREMGARAAAAEVDAAILELAERLVDPALVPALTAAAKAAIEDAAESRARAAIDALRRAKAPADAVDELERTLLERLPKA
jgi:tetratricopeptide (TPR) repeat protein